MGFEIFHIRDSAHGAAASLVLPTHSPAIMSSSLMRAASRGGIRLLAASSVRAAGARSFASVNPDAIFRNKSTAPAVKGGAAPAKKAEAKDLASVLERELAYEREDNTTVETLKSLAAGIVDFKLVDTAGHARFHLTRTLGRQEIRIDVDCTPVSTDDDSAEELEGVLRAGGFS